MSLQFGCIFEDFDIFRKKEKKHPRDNSCVGNVGLTYANKQGERYVWEKGCS